MGKLEKIGRSILKKFGNRRSSSRRRREQEDVVTSTSSDEEYVHKFQVVPPEDTQMTSSSQNQATSESEDVRMGSPAASDEGSAGYATDDTALSSLGPLDIKRVSIDYSESQGYYSNAELSPIPRIEITVPEGGGGTVANSPRRSPLGTVHEVPAHLRDTVPELIYQDPTVPADLRDSTVPLRDTVPTYKTPAHLRGTVEASTIPEHAQPFPDHLAYTVPTHQTRFQDPTEPLRDAVPTISIPKIVGATLDDTVTHRTPLYAKKLSQEFPRIDVTRNKLMKKHEPIYKSSSQLLNVENKENQGKIERSATLSNLTSSEEEDPIERFMKSHIYKTKMITTVFEAKDRGFEILITATNSEDETVTSSTILKIHVENLDDNEPMFLESSLPLYRILQNTSKPTAIGRLTAQDADSSPIFYHLLPNCGSPEISKNFSIDSEFGEIIYHPKGPVEDTVAELCFIATSQKELDTSEVFFDGEKKNFKKILIEFMGENAKNSGKMLDGIPGNQSISQVGDVLDRIEIPMVLNSGVGEFELKNLQFVPANYELGRDMISPEGAVELNKKTGEIVANGKILDTPQGVYTAEIGKEGQVAMKQLHHIRNDRKLRYVLSMSKNEFGANLEKFKRQILEAIGKDDQKAGKQLDIHFDQPKSDRKNSTWTSVCFYLTRENAILDDKQTSALVSPSNGHISKLHHIFKVQNVDNCSPRVTTSSESTSSTSSDIPLNTLILIGVVGLLIIALIALLVFVCCVSRYQRYLKQKTDRMRCNSSAGSYYKSPNLIPPPGYMHTPPLPPPPPPPQAIAFY